MLLVHLNPNPMCTYTLFTYLRTVHRSEQQSSPDLPTSTSGKWQYLLIHVCKQDVVIFYKLYFYIYICIIVRKHTKPQPKGVHVHIAPFSVG